MREGFKGKATNFKRKIDLIAKRYGVLPHQVATLDWDEFYFNLEIARTMAKEDEKDLKKKVEK